MDLSFRVDAQQANAEWVGIVRLMQVEIWRTPTGYDTRGKAEVAAKLSFAEALRDALRLNQTELEDVVDGSGRLQGRIAST